MTDDAHTCPQARAAASEAVLRALIKALTRRQPLLAMDILQNLASEQARAEAVGAKAPHDEADYQQALSDWIGQLKDQALAA